MERVAEAVGTALRRARNAQGLSLQEAAKRSGGRFAASAIGGYERGERAISLERFILLAQIYGVPADRLVREVLAGMAVRVEEVAVIDLTKVPTLPPEPRRAVTDFLRHIQSWRNDFLADVITLRSGDIEVLAFSAGMSVQELLRRLAPAQGNRELPASN
jgi:transcriptional regulator with XRE-family HTH domain